MAPIVEWNASLSVGVDFIDADHKVLVNQINMLADAVNAGDDTVMTASVLNVLIDYTAYHFGREQQLMEATNFPGADAHLREHRMLVKKVRDIQAAYQGGSALGGDVLTFLKVWLTQHIQKSDVEFGKHLTAKGAARTVPPRLQGAVEWSNISVLVVDDQFNFRSLMRNILNSIGVSMIREAKNGAEALEMLSNESVDVVMTDDDMSPCNGLEFTHRLGTSRGLPDPRTIVILMPSQEITKEYLGRHQCRGP